VKSNEGPDPANAVFAPSQEDAMSSAEIIVATLTRHLRDIKSLREGARIRRLRASYEALVENENWLAGKIDPLASPKMRR
jgi:hypothetical protein